MVVLVVPLTILVISPAVQVVSPATIAGSCGNCHNVGRVGVRRRKGFGDRGRLTFRPYESPKIIEGSANDRVLQFMDRLELPNVARYYEVDSELLDFAWQTFGATPAGWPRVRRFAISSMAVSRRSKPGGGVATSDRIHQADPFHL